MRPYRWPAFAAAVHRKAVERDGRSPPMVTGRLGVVVVSSLWGAVHYGRAY